MESSDRVVVVIPARDEAAHLPQVLAQLPPQAWRVILVDDASRDGTAGVMRAWGDPRGSCVRSEVPLGVGGAILLGYRHALAAGARVAVVVAADAQMDLDELSKVAEPVLGGTADYVQGCRFGGDGRPRGVRDGAAPVPRGGGRASGGVSHRQRRQQPHRLRA